MYHDFFILCWMTGDGRLHLGTPWCQNNSHFIQMKNTFDSGLCNFYYPVSLYHPKWIISVFTQKQFKPKALLSMYMCKIQISSDIPSYRVTQICGERYLLNEDLLIWRQGKEVPPRINGGNANKIVTFPLPVRSGCTTFLQTGARCSKHRDETRAEGAEESPASDLIDTFIVLCKGNATESRPVRHTLCSFRGV